MDAGNLDKFLSKKTSLLELFVQQHRELNKRQREYKKLLLNKEKTRNDSIIMASYENANEHLEIEKNNLKAQIWLAGSKAYSRKNQCYLNEIQCKIGHVENLVEDIRKLKVSVANMESEISRVDKEIYDLNRSTVPDSQHQQHVRERRRRLTNLENKVEVSARQECGFIATNQLLRKQITNIINNREFFNESYVKIVLKLNHEQKYLFNILEYALNTFDGCIAVYEKMGYLLKRRKREDEMRKVEMLGLMRQVVADAVNNDFLEIKGQTRVPFDLQPKEYKRREDFRRKHRNKINLYNSVVEKILEYTESKKISEVISKYNEHKSVYYSYISYANEMSYHITLLNNSVNQLYKEIQDQKHDTVDRINGQIEEEAQLAEKLKEQQESNTKLTSILENNDKHLRSLVHGFEFFSHLCFIDSALLRKLLSDKSYFHLVEFRNFIKTLERRIQEVIAAVYMQERRDESPLNYVVKNIDKICDVPTDLNDIVLTQQCPECAIGDAFNIDDGATVNVHTKYEAKKRLYEKINQPEMQYCLHSLSTCRLPRSRNLAAKRMN